MSVHIKKVICLTDNFPDGQKITGAQIIYDRALDVNRITPAAFRVKDRRITGFSAEDCTVTIALDPADKAAPLIESPSKDEAPKHIISPEKPGEKDQGPLRNMPSAVRRPVQIEVMQKTPVAAEDGSFIEPFDYIVSDTAIEPVVSDFVQAEYKGIPYNLFIPKEYDGKTGLPLVMFIHDAGPCGPDPKITLSQGSGAISFADPKWQAEHPCFVLAPQIDRTIRLTGPNSTVSPELESIKEMLDDVVQRYNIDKKRIYATGQSMGCMASCELNIRYPELFAASLLVAGQWSPEKIAENCSGCKFWILVSEHDARAFPGMNAVTEALEEKGVKIGRYWWDGKSGDEELTEKAREAMKDDVQMRYTVFYGSSVVPANIWPHPGSNHTSTWNRVYPIRGVREWLFSNVKD